ncbi:MAG TPA: aminotransferase class III-fold pyridoxal phosphate-dependent enzyme [Candidatus Omnitrophota bacterium]|nr:aminotransferase class III-fold pyridoxal phosphate-dependent enzyme [Candidatus Omnitrophota bacterium]
MKDNKKNIFDSSVKGPALWKRAKELIPGGNQLLSKRAELFLPDFWPAYYSRAHGAKIWDLDENELIDMSLMGVGTCVLGYSNAELNKRIMHALNEGSMSTLNSFEEVELAERLIALHPWAEMARFSRSGGEAAAIAIRIARAAAGKDKIAFCGYHGWTDWYLATNIQDSSNLNHQLLPGLDPRGVPKALQGTVIPFQYGKLSEFENLISEHGDNMGIIIMEVVRYEPIDINFLKRIRQISRERGIVLIFDEITSGYRCCAGGLHRLYDIEPDMMLLGKAMGNGHPITAILGRKAIMNAAQDTFISSTFWSERVGFVAALEVLRQYEKYNVASHLMSVGQHLVDGWSSIFKKLDLKISAVGLLSSPYIRISEADALVIKTYFTQEMFSRGYLASNQVFLSLAHTPEVIDDYLAAAEAVFCDIKAKMTSKSLLASLRGPVCHSGFQRLN